MKGQAYCFLNCAKLYIRTYFVFSVSLRHAQSCTVRSKYTEISLSIKLTNLQVVTFKNIISNKLLFITPHAQDLSSKHSLKQITVQSKSTEWIHNSLLYFLNLISHWFYTYVKKIKYIQWVFSFRRHAVYCIKYYPYYACFLIVNKNFIIL